MNENQENQIDPGDPDLEVSPLSEYELAELTKSEAFFDDTQLAITLQNHANYCWRRGAARHDRDRSKRNGMLVCMEGYLTGNINDALGAFLHLENDNKGAREQIQVAHQRLSNFWDLTFYSSDKPSDISVIPPHLKWQYENHIQSLVDCLSSYNAGQHLQALKHLLFTQQHNADVLAYYRACWRDRKEEIINIIKSYIGS